MWCAYILLCANKALYTGITNNLERRLLAHNSGRGARYTRGFGPVKLLWQEHHRNRSSASRREAQIKRLSRLRKLALIKAAL